MATWTVVAPGQPERLRRELLLELEPGRPLELEQLLELAGRALASSTLAPRRVEALNLPERRAWDAARPLADVLRPSCRDAVAAAERLTRQPVRHPGLDRTCREPLDEERRARESRVRRSPTARE
jgi:hypothetical protein